MSVIQQANGAVPIVEDTVTQRWNDERGGGGGVASGVFLSHTPRVALTAMERGARGGEGRCLGCVLGSHPGSLSQCWGGGPPGRGAWGHEGVGFARVSFPGAGSCLPRLGV